MTDPKTFGRKHHHHHHHHEGVPTTQELEELALEIDRQAGNLIRDIGGQDPLQTTGGLEEISAQAEKKQGGAADADDPLNTRNFTHGDGSSTTTQVVDPKVEVFNMQKPHHEKVQSDLTWDPECTLEETDKKFQQNILINQHPIVVAAPNQDSFVRVSTSQVTSSVLSDFATESTSMESDRTVIPVRPSFIHRRRHHPRNKTPTTSVMGQSVLEDVQESVGTDSSSPRIGVKEMVNVLRRSDARIQVNWEQIERVKYMHDRFTQGSEFSFNYNVLLMVASLLAALGLVSNSSTTVIAR